ncbi:MAG TPA: signal peptidase I [Chondromyces sp.]|nr:signal peptidase I [Chondromyces sp.]
MSKSVAREYYEAILVAFILALFVRTFVFENFKIPSGSMEDNLLIGDHLVVNKFIFAGNAGTFLHRLFPYRAPERGDVVVFKYPEDPRRDFIKRCVAVGGDTVEIRRKQLFVNGRAQEEPHAVHKDPRVYDDSSAVPVSARIRDNFGPMTVPEGSIFCLGDNRDNSLDSRFWGPVPLSYVKGRAVLIYWSYEAGRDDWQWRGFGHRLKQLAGVVLNFFTKTRWERAFQLIH